MDDHKKIIDMQKSAWASIYARAADELKIVKWPDEFVVRASSKWDSGTGIRTILDLGCGTGRHALFFATVGFEAHGLDFSDKAITIARDQATLRGVNASFYCASMLETGFADNSFDAVVAWRSLHELPYNDMPQAIREICRIVKPGGRVLVAVGGDASTIPSDETRYRFVLSLDKVKELFSCLNVQYIERNIFTYQNRQFMSEYWILEAIAP